VPSNHEMWHLPGTCGIPLWPHSRLRHITIRMGRQDEKAEDLICTKHGAACKSPTLFNNVGQRIGRCTTQQPERSAHATPF